MLKMRSRTIVLAGVTLALLGAGIVFAYARSVTATAGGGASVSAFVATDDIPAGTKWDAAMEAVTQRSVPESLRPSSAINEPSDLTGSRSVRHIAKGEVVTEAQFGKVGAAPAAGLEIPPGHNAVAVNVAPPQGLAQYAQPGDLVNVFVTIQGTPADGTITRLLLSNIQVLANRSAGADQSSASGGQVLLMLALTPDQAERVIFSKEQGSLWFGLVRPGDEPASTNGRTAQNLLG